MSSAGKVTVGLASHCPYVVDFSGLATHGLKAYVRKMRSPPTVLMGHDTLCLPYIAVSVKQWSGILPSLCLSIQSYVMWPVHQRSVFKMVK